ncbi:MAG: di-trans,poly-cis-decaprenylcistransferase [Spirochaetes bacterium GWD1_61_31]|nr:MAG: di-trans,poly-cis-decaprenylcistransferase [Spirochaetes bacterium GWB1_60_80]OHD29630.1 MAG: di-trans,poly-cis-decaprenylcistransferase [Spirochaetes bacterium GWC1_61_12]OHD37534.1 MAG: di-trans,poly-cis-decaprenylcistransferase [Spirochaetes bacterium GWD1_61_31]OHD41956.1 MAG: di-trans,poly-cis-decaprenylcistransferase [Spirochaetes bacterium GWE1_60_18]OHD61778.1 MAG: di-trans,poly-cis-decaprenylcistransferase [Spirochaetes bacterium GWF1_60_12]
MAQHGTILPRHVGIIMDGNGRWAQGRGLPRTEGHKQGLLTAKKIVLAASELGITYLSLYTFSTENWKRAAEEVGFLMNLIPGSLIRELPFYREHDIRVVHAGDRARLPENVVAALSQIAEATAGHRGLTVNLAINYGGRDEIVRAANRLITLGVKEATPENFSAALDIPDLPDLDLIIRTGGERRLSNFFLWHSAYAELHFSDTLWPDWDEAHFQVALADFGSRQRRYGGLS